MRPLTFAILLVAVAGSRLAQATVVEVNSKHNIYGAGLGSGPEIVGDGLSPVVHNFAAGANQVLTFTSVTGTVNYYGGTQPSTEGPDGYGPSFFPYPPGEFPTSPLSFEGFHGLSGLRDTNNGAYLVGVFLTDAAPAPPAPPLPDFSNNKSFASLSPLIAQFFFIGDGLTGTGSGDVQEFFVPPTATRLYMGFIDSAFVDNLGSLTATFEINTIPEPSSLLLLLLGCVSWINSRIAISIRRTNCLNTSANMPTTSNR
jgi:hypothetical protein